MKILLVLVIVLAHCSLCLAATQDVGGDYGLSWLTQNGNKFVSDKGSSTKDLWNWGGKPLGYEVQNGKLYHPLAPTEWYYPAFMSNATPIVINGTALLRNANSAPIDFLFPDIKNDPWYIAENSERPVAVIYPSWLKKPTLQ